MLIAFVIETVLLYCVFAVARRLCQMAVRPPRLLRSGEGLQRSTPIHGKASSPVIIALFTGI